MQILVFLEHIIVIFNHLGVL